MYVQPTFLAFEKKSGLQVYSFSVLSSDTVCFSIPPPHPQSKKNYMLPLSRNTLYTL